MLCWCAFPLAPALRSTGSAAFVPVDASQQKGCLSEKLLRCRDAPEFISYSEWESEAVIEVYRNSDAHKEIVRHTRGLKGAKAKVKLYDLVQ